MAVRRFTLSYDDEKHSSVHLGLSNHGEDSDSAYVRKCIEFFEIHKGETINQHLILERLQRIEVLLKNGIQFRPSGDPVLEDQTHDIFEELLEQIE